MIEVNLIPRPRADRPSDSPAPAAPPRRRRSDHEPNFGYVPVLAIALAVAAVDWFTKFLIATTLPVGGFVEIANGAVALWHVRNPAMVLGLWGDLPLAGRKAIAALAGCLSVLLFFQIVTRGHRLLPRQRWSVWLFAGLAFGGMLGNLGERAVHWGVTDYLSIRWGGLWLPPANIADLALLLSMVFAILAVAFELSARARRGKGHPRHAMAVRAAASPDPAP